MARTAQDNRLSGTPPILDVLDDVRENDRGWMAKCPAHEDRSASLSVAVGGDGRTLVNCFASCHTADVVAAAGLAWTDLFAAGPATPRLGNLPRRIIRRKPAREPRPIDAIVAAANVAGLGWRCGVDPDMWLLAQCPYCLSPENVWLWAPQDEPLRFSCADGCSTDEILASIETQAAIAEEGGR